MIPNMNPGQMKKLMQQMGIKNIEIPATRVVVEKEDGSQLVVKNPQVMMIEMGGAQTLQVSGEFSEEQGTGNSNEKGENKGEAGQQSKEQNKEQTDVDIVMEQTSASREDADRALQEAKGDIAEAIMLIEARK